MSFSDGCFFACSTTRLRIYLWKESPTGYILHGVLTSNDAYPTPLLSKNGESIVAFCGSTIQLWRTKGFPTSPSTILTRASQHLGNILEFSPDGMLAVAAVRGDNTVTVLDLKSGVPHMVINGNMEVWGLGMTKNTVVVVGGGRVINWVLPAGDYAPGARAGPEDSSQTLALRVLQNGSVTSASISPDSRYIALAEGTYLRIYSTSTGEQLREAHTGWALIPRFSPDGCHVLCIYAGCMWEAWRIVSDGEGCLRDIVRVECLVPAGEPWKSSRGYRVTDDWWILGPEGRRLLLLPPLWQSSLYSRAWKGQFLALLHHALPEPVVLDLEINHDL